MTTMNDFEEAFARGKELGKGTYGTVFQATEKSSERVVAVKQMRTIGQNAKQIAKREIDLLKSVKHPHILEFIADFYDRKCTLIVTEYLDGGELFDRVCDEETIPEADCCNYVSQICTGLEYLHENKIVHLDMKPENVVLTSQDSKQIKIIDFGLATILNENQEVQVMQGTPDYIAPEVLNYNPVDFKTDMWSVGVITYLLISGVYPFGSDHEYKTFANITSVAYDFEDESFENASSYSKDFIELLLQKEPEHRLSAAECLQHPWLIDVTTQRGMLRTTSLRNYITARKKFKKLKVVLQTLGTWKGHVSEQQFKRESSSDLLEDLPKIPSEDSIKQVITENSVESLDGEIIEDPNNNKDSDIRINGSFNKEDENADNTDEITSDDMNLNDEEHNINNDELNATTDDSSFDNTREIGRFMELINDDKNKVIPDDESSYTRILDDNGEFSNDDNSKDSGIRSNAHSNEDELEPVVNAFEDHRDQASSEGSSSSSEGNPEEINHLIDDLKDIPNKNSRNETNADTNADLNADLNDDLNKDLNHISNDTSNDDSNDTSNDDSNDESNNDLKEDLIKTTERGIEDMSSGFESTTSSEGVSSSTDTYEEFMYIGDIIIESDEEYDEDYHEQEDNLPLPIEESYPIQDTATIIDNLSIKDTSTIEVDKYTSGQKTDSMPQPVLINLPAIVVDNVAPSRKNPSLSPDHQQPDINKMLSTGAKRADKKIRDIQRSRTRPLPGKVASLKLVFQSGSNYDSIGLHQVREKRTPSNSPDKQATLRSKPRPSSNLTVNHHGSNLLSALSNTKHKISSSYDRKASPTSSMNDRYNTAMPSGGKIGNYNPVSTENRQNDSTTSSGNNLNYTSGEKTKDSPDWKRATRPSLKVRHGNFSDLRSRFESKPNSLQSVQENDTVAQDNKSNYNLLSQHSRLLTTGLRSSQQSEPPKSGGLKKSRPSMRVPTGQFNKFREKFAK